MRTEHIRRSYKIVNVTQEPIILKHYSIQWAPIKALPNIVTEVAAAVWTSNRIRWSQQLILVSDDLEVGSKFIPEADTFVDETEDEVDEGVAMLPEKKTARKPEALRAGKAK